MPFTTPRRSAASTATPVVPTPQSTPPQPQLRPMAPTQATHPGKPGQRRRTAATTPALTWIDLLGQR